MLESTPGDICVFNPRQSDRPHNPHHLHHLHQSHTSPSLDLHEVAKY